MTTLLPTDADNNPIPAMRLKAGGAHKINAGALSARNTVPFDADTKVVSVYATGPVYLRFGNASVAASATDHYYPAKTYYDFAISGGDSKGPHNSYLAVLRADADCEVYMSEKE